MIAEQKTQTISFEKGNTRVEFLPTGDIKQMLNGDILINQYIGNNLDGSINNLYLRYYKEDNLYVCPLLGCRSKSEFSYSQNKAIWKGSIEGIPYRVTFSLGESGIWFWDIDLRGKGQTVDIIYGQDISMGVRGGTLTNELYISQYLGHTINKGEHGFVVSSRQNQKQNKHFPYIQQGCLNEEIIGYSTDAMQFFGKSYKKTNQPEILKSNLPNINYQFEMSYVALQTKKIVLDGAKNVTFYGITKENHESEVNTIEFMEEVKHAYENCVCDQEGIDVSGATLISPIQKKDSFREPLVSLSLTKEEIETYFPERKLEEYDGNQLLSFFTPDHRHVVMLEKELLVERPHGHIITTAVDVNHINRAVMASTNYMYGIFNSQVVVGNTSLHKLLSTSRGLLNLFKNSGQRIYIKIENQYHLLTLPAAYELGIHYSKWYYKLEQDTIIVTSFCVAQNTEIVLEVSSEKGNNYEYLVTQQLVMGEIEYEENIELNRDGKTITIQKDKNSLKDEVYKDLLFRYTVEDADFTMSDDRVFYEGEESFNTTMLTMVMESTNHFRINIEGYLNETTKEPYRYELEEEYKKYQTIYKELTCNFHLRLPQEYEKDLDRFNEVVWWYTHNAMIHYMSPHGLEQPGGAAWGTRDVCQGPLEFFLATGHYKLAKEIIEEIFAHQFLEVGEWPQWFMFDQYKMQQDDCHGDVVFWPLKVLGDYIRITGDNTILESKVPYRHFECGEITDSKETIKEHVKRGISTIKKRFLYDTYLITYAGGDWDDTLQPASDALKEKLVSAWTVALAYQTILQLSTVFHNIEQDLSSELSKMADGIKESFHKYLIKDDVVAGFALLEDANSIEYMLHPEDKKTGIHYRLLPMTRSIIGELVDEEQARKNITLIHKHLACPDGVRLMDHPARYKGGVSEIFQRAEQAANVGREISLQYVHAHIRYGEAMAKLGKKEEAWNALNIINPINIKENVPNAVLRQSNTYFSSSEGCFNDRYEFSEGFHKLRTGDVSVKGGWRIYSSGPGIYINQLISNLLGIRFTKDTIILDPNIPMKFNHLELEYQIDSKPVTIIYHIKDKNKEVTKVMVNDTDISWEKKENKYRISGCVILKKYINNLLKENNKIEIYLD